MSSERRWSMNRLNHESLNHLRISDNKILVVQKRYLGSPSRNSAHRYENDEVDTIASI